MRSLRVLFFPWRAGRRDEDSGASLAERFGRIHRENRWRAEESRSGPGSTLARTRNVRATLPELLCRLGARTLLDLPCGDFHWMKEVELDLDSYVGADIVPALVEANRRDHAREGRTFLVLDITRDDLPRADVVLCRDCLIHLSFADTARAVGRLRASGSTYLLTTTFPGRRRNVDKPSGRSRLLNLERPPFSWPAPLDLIPEDRLDRRGQRYRKSLGLWRIADLPGRGGRKRK